MDNSLGCVFGQKGSGKTTLLRELIRSYDRVLVLDLLAEYDGEGVRVLEGDRDQVVRGIAALEKERRFRVAVRAFDLDDNLAALWVAKELPKTLIILEEASMLCSAYSLPDAVAWVVRYGRHRELDLIFVSRRPAEVSRDVTANADWVVTFRQTEPNDLLYLRARGFDPDAVRDLGPWQVAAVGNTAKLPYAVSRRLGETNPAPAVAEVEEPEEKSLTATEDAP